MPGAAPFSAKLFDGQTARAWLVGVTLTADHALRLSPPDALNGLPDWVPAEWHLADLTLEGAGVPGFLGIRHQPSGAALESTDAALNAALRRQLGYAGVGEELSNRLGGSATGVLLILGLLVGLAGVVWWWGLPWAASRAVALLPPSFDRELGRRAAGALLESEVEDTAATRHLRAFGRAMRLDSSVRLHVLRSPQLNAFALPGGEVFVFRALADSLRTPGELAALLGHELAHVERRHGTQALARALAGYLLAAALIGDVGGISAVLLDGARALGQLDYSRSLEAEADELGIRRLGALGYSPQAMADLFRRLDATAGRHEPGALEILSDHPALAARIERAEAAARQWQATRRPDPALARAFDSLQAALYEE